MKVTFTYSKEKDIWCLTRYGKSSNNSSSPTKEYSRLTAFTGENPSNDMVSYFIDKHVIENKISTALSISTYQHKWDIVADRYQEIAEGIFGVTIKDDVTAYITINSRCPYSIEQNSFFVSVPTYSAVKTAMQELWHFYTWYKFGITWE